jgi:hypothetical protein
VASPFRVFVTAFQFFAYFLSFSVCHYNFSLWTLSLIRHLDFISTLSPGRLLPASGWLAPPEAGKL